MAVPVVGQAGFDQEELAGEAQVVLDGGGEAVRLAPGIVERLPRRGAGRIGHADGAAQVIGVDHGEHRRCGVDGGHEGQGQIDRRIVIAGQPDVFPECRSGGAIGFGDQVAVEVVDVVHRAHRSAWRSGDSCYHLLERIVGVGRGLRCRAGACHADRAVPDIVGGGEGVAAFDIDGDVARRIMGEAAGYRAVGGDVG